MLQQNIKSIANRTPRNRHSAFALSLDTQTVDLIILTVQPAIGKAYNVAFISDAGVQRFLSMPEYSPEQVQIIDYECVTVPLCEVGTVHLISCAEVV